jgi:Xaa-Pro aminopeptidase
MRPGVTGGEVWEIGNQVAEEFGWADNINLVYLGHTTGITTSVRPVIAKGETKEIKAGSFVNIEPGIFIPGVGSSSLENTLYVTETETKPINQYTLNYMLFSISIRRSVIG